MKVNIDTDSYIDIDKSADNDGAILSLKVKKDEKSYILISLALNEDVLDKLISEMVSIRAGI